MNKQKNKCFILYLLSEEGQKESLLTGGNGKTVQIIETDITREILDLGNVDFDGNAFVTIGFSNYTYQDYKKNKKLDNIKGKETYATIQENHLYAEPVMMAHKEVKFFDTPQSTDDLITYEHDRIAKYNESISSLKPELENKLDEYKKQQDEDMKIFHDILKKNFPR